MVFYGSPQIYAQDFMEALQQYEQAQVEQTYTPQEESPEYFAQQGVEQELQKIAETETAQPPAEAAPIWDYDSQSAAFYGYSQAVENAAEKNEEAFSSERQTTDDVNTGIAGAVVETSEDLANTAAVFWDESVRPRVSNTYQEVQQYEVQQYDDSFMKAYDFALNVSDEEKARIIKENWDLPPDTSKEQVTETVDDSLNSFGYGMTGDFSNFSLYSTRSRPSLNLVVPPDLKPEEMGKQHLTVAKKTAKWVVNFISGGAVDLGEKFVKLVKEAQDVQNIYEQSDLVELDKNRSEGRPSWMESLTAVLAGSEQNTLIAGIAVAQLAKEKSEEDLARYKQYLLDPSIPDSSKEWILQYIEKTENLQAETDNLVLETAAWEAMMITAPGFNSALGAAGGKLKPLVSYGAKKAKPVLVNVLEALSRLAGRKTVTEGTELAIEPVYVGASQSLEGLNLVTEVAVGTAKVSDRARVDALRPQAEDIARQLFGREGTEDEIHSLAVSLYFDDIPEQIMIEAAREARLLADHLQSGKEMLFQEAPDEVKRIWRKYGMIAENPYLDFTNGADPDDFALGAARMLAGEEVQVQRLGIDNLIEKANKQLTELERYVLEYHPDPVKPDSHQIIREQVSVIPDKQMNRLAPRADGFANFKNEIFLRSTIAESAEKAQGVMLHECFHNCTFNASPEYFDQTLYKVLSKDNAYKLNEGLTEFATRFMSDNPEVRAVFRSEDSLGPLVDSSRFPHWVYREQSTAVHDELIPIIMQNRGVTRNEANAVVLGAVRNGMYDELIKSVGISELRQVLDRLPSVASDLATRNPIVITPADIALAIAQAAAITGGFVYQYQEKPQLLPFRLVNNVFAGSNDAQQGVAMDANAFELLVKQQLIKNALAEDGRVDSEFIKEVMKLDILKSKFEEVKNGYLLTTGKAGTVEGEITEGKYKITVGALPGIDIKIPAIVDLAKNASAVIPVDVKQGSGKVEKTSTIVGSKDNQDEDNFSKVKVAVVSDTDQVLPWAGMNIKLEKIDKEKAIYLNNGWNLVTLAALPEQPLTASTLLTSIAQQGGYATTISTLENGAWKSYVIRGDKDYSGEDFAIEPGKAYFVKALKKSDFTFIGQEFASPIKTQLSSGWNAVGFPKTSKVYQAADLGAEVLARWESGLWDSFVKKDAQEYGENFRISGNRGYILKVGKEVEFSP